MQGFSVIEGKQSPYYNHFEDYAFESCVASDTRMMGVIALKAKFRARDDSGAVLHILMHLDYSEYGVDEYLEYFHENERFANADNFLLDDWETIYSGLGGELYEISFADMLYYINSAMIIFDEMRDPAVQDELKSFRETVSRKMSQLRGCPDIPELGDPRMHLAKVCKSPLSDKEVVNYFLMRLSDRDLEGAGYLSDIPKEILENTSMYRNGIQTLMRNTIEIDTSSEETIKCVTKSLSMNPNNYFFYAAEIELRNCSATPGEKAPGTPEYMICDYRELDSYEVTEFEAALQLKHAEYIAVYTIHEEDMYFDIERCKSVKNVRPTEVPAGELRLRYYDTNVHVDSTDYVLDYDVFGAYLVTDMDELLIMSTVADNAAAMEMDILSEYPESMLELQDRYRFETQIFQTFAYSHDLLFSDMLEGDRE